jgi:outer membrane protein assembly factor BamB
MRQKLFQYVFLMCALSAVVSVSGCRGEKRMDPLTYRFTDSVWTNFRGPASGGTGVAADSIAPPFGLLWKVKIPGDLKAGLRSSPVADAQRVYIGSLDGHVYAFDRKSGKQAWKFQTGGSVWAPPLVADGAVYIGSEGGNFYALDAATGKVLDSFDSAQKPVIHSGAAVAGGLVFFGANDNYLYALDRKDLSRIAWHTRTDDWIESTPLVSGGAVFAGSNDGRLYKFDLETGRILWSFTTAGPVYSTPVASGGNLYFTSWDGHAYAIRAKDKKLLWKTRVDEQASGSLALKNGVLYGGTMFPDGRLFALDAKTGKMLRSFETRGGFDASPVISGDILYIGSFDDNFYAVDINNFAIKWKRPMRGTPRATCAIAGGVLYAPDLQGRLLAFAPIK